jgi:hypothetical protein
LGFKGIDWVLIKTTAIVTSASNPPLLISGLFWPRYADSVGRIEAVVASSTLYNELQSNLVSDTGGVSFPTPNANSFLQATLSVS